MNDRQLVASLRMLAEEKKIEYIVKSVKARWAAKAINESRRSRRLAEAGLVQTGDTFSKASTPTSTRQFSGGSLPGQVQGGDYPSPKAVSDEVGDLVLKAGINVAPDSTIDLLLSPSGHRGSYGSLYDDYHAFKKEAEAAKSQSTNIDSLVKAILAPGKSEEDLKKLRSAAARLMRAAPGAGRKVTAK